MEGKLTVKARCKCGRTYDIRNIPIKCYCGNTDWPKHYFTAQNNFTKATWPMSDTTPPPLDAVLNERGSRYGAFADNAFLYHALKQAMERAAPKGHKLTAVQQNALDQIFVKLSRIGTGDPNYRDNWVDIAGYAQLVVAECDGEKR